MSIKSIEIQANLLGTKAADITLNTWGQYSSEYMPITYSIVKMLADSVFGYDYDTIEELEYDFDINKAEKCSSGYCTQIRFESGFISVVWID